MSALDRLWQELERARPADPNRAESDRAAVRVLARLAVLDAGARDEVAEPRRGRTLRVVAAAACLAVGVVLWPADVPPPKEAALHMQTDRIASEPDATPKAQPEDPLRVLARRALSGDTLARTRLRDRGREGRRALLDMATASEAQAPAALAMLRSFGSLRSAAEVERIAQLARNPRLRTEAIPLLAADLGSAGAAYLGRLLEADAACEAEAVAALAQVARRGRRRAAVSSLLRGARAGRVHAAARALALGGAAELRQVLDALPTELQADPVIASAIESGPRTLRYRTLHMAQRGDDRALTLAARAGIRGVVPLLEARALGEESEAAAHAVQLLAERESVRAWVALGRALDGTAGEAVRERLARADEATLDELMTVALESPRDMRPALAALAAAGTAGLERLRDLARAPAVGTHAVTAMASSRAPGVAGALGEVAAQPARRFEVVAALGARLKQGDEDAGSTLLALARDGMQRAVLRALAGCGEAGVRWLREAEREPELRRRARAWLQRVNAAPSRGAAAPSSAI